MNNLKETSEDWDMLFEKINNVNINDNFNNIFNDCVDDIKNNDINNQEKLFLSKINEIPDFSDNLKIEFKKCPKCNIEYLLDNNMMYCKICGSEKDLNTDNNNFSMSYSTTYNTSDNSFVSFKFIGKGSYAFHKSFLKTCANYSKYSHNNIIRELNNLVYQHNGNKIPKNIILLAAEMYNKIRFYGKVFRGDSKKGVMVACVYYACRINKITKTPRYLCTLTKTPDKYLSQGERILQDYIERRLLEIPKLDDPKIDYLSQYFEALKLPKKYKKFTIELIYRAEEKSLHIIKDSRDTTKCAGTIYMLCSRVPELKYITKEKIEENCDVSKTTFLRYYNLLCDNYKKIKKIFIRYEIPMPNAWRN